MKFNLKDNLKLYALLFPLALGALLLTACEDTIESDDRYTPTDIPEPKRSVLVEEYTGAKCVNCPLGHAVMEQLEELYNTDENALNGIELITVGIHIPNWGWSVSAGGLITPEATYLDPGGITPPQAQVNRNGKILDRVGWGKEIAIQFARTPEVTFPNRVTATCSGTTLSVSGEVIAPSNIDDSRLHVWVVEDSIEFRQVQPDGTVDTEYIHNNVYRAHMTESYDGENLPLTRNSARQFSYTYPVSERWNTENLRVVVFLDTPDGGVLNATQSPVRPL